jgi:hypothetical protein
VEHLARLIERQRLVTYQHDGKWALHQARSKPR